MHKGESMMCILPGVAQSVNHLSLFFELMTRHRHLDVHEGGQLRCGPHRDGHGVFLSRYSRRSSGRIGKSVFFEMRRVVGIGSQKKSLVPQACRALSGVGFQVGRAPHGGARS